MKRLLLVLAAVAVLAAPAHARDSRVLESQTKTYASKNLDTVKLDFPVGELTIEGTNTKEVKLTVRIHCKRSEDWCEMRADELELDARTRSGRLTIEVDGYSWWGDTDDYWIEAVVEVPQNLDLQVDMGVGELEIQGMEADLDVNLKVGEATVRMDESKVSRVHANVTIGEASLDRPGGRQSVSGFLGRQLRWSKGAGDARVDVSVGVGELNLRLI